MDVIINAVTETFLSTSTATSTSNLVTQGDFLLNCLVQLGQNAVYTPLADLLRQYHRLEDGGHWLILSPIHWQVTHHDAMIVEYGNFAQLTEARSKIWFAEVSEFLAQDNMTLFFHSPDYWLVHTVDKPLLKSPNLPFIQHRSLMPMLAELDGTMYWQRLFTELQMFLSTHPLNMAPDLKTPINGLWFWGGGMMQNAATISQFKPRQLFTDSPIIQQVFAESLSLERFSEAHHDAVIAVQQPTPDLIAQLEQFTKKITCNWFWNNLAYPLKRAPWYKAWFRQRPMEK